MCVCVCVESSCLKAAKQETSFRIQDEHVEYLHKILKVAVSMIPLLQLQCRGIGVILHTYRYIIRIDVLYIYIYCFYYMYYLYI